MSEASSYSVAMTDEQNSRLAQLQDLQIKGNPDLVFLWIKSNVQHYRNLFPKRLAEVPGLNETTTSKGCYE